MNERDRIMAELRAWVVRANGRIAPEELADDTPLIQERIITSLQVMDLLLLIERLSGRRVDARRIAPGSFHSIDAILERFFDHAIVSS